MAARSSMVILGAMNADIPIGPAAGSEPDRQRKTRKIRMSDYERGVLIQSIEAQIAAADSAEQRTVLETLLTQIRPKRRRTTQQVRTAFQVVWTDAGSGDDRDCGHTHGSHLEAQNCARQLADDAIDGQVVPVVS